MSAPGSNTSGTKVANVGWWPKGLLQALLAGIKTTYDTLKRVLTGEVSLLQVDFIAQSGTEKIPNDLREEIARFLVVTLEKEAQGNVVFSTTPPDDKSKVWWQTDTAGNPIGSPKLWNATINQWVPITSAATPYVPPLERHGTLYAPVGNSTVNFDFPDLHTDDYKAIITPTTFLNGSWGVAPPAFPTHAGWTVINKTTSQISVAFFGQPTGGLTYEIDIEVRPSQV